MQTPGKLELEIAELSDIGLRRRNNQDSLAVATAASEEIWQSRGHLFVVADGMVWSGNLVSSREPGITTGRDVNTGEVKRRRPKDQTFFEDICHFTNQGYAEFGENLIRAMAAGAK